MNEGSVIAAKNRSQHTLADSVRTLSNAWENVWPGESRGIMSEREQHVKDAGLENVIGRLGQYLGSMKGPHSPYGKLAGPLFGSLLQGLGLGALGYGAGRLLTPLYAPQLDPKRVAGAAGLLGFLAPGALHAPHLIANWQARRPGQNIFQALNVPVSEYQG